MSYSHRSKPHLNAPFMFAFRDAHAARDARLAAGQANENGKIVQPSRHAAISVISEQQLRTELMRDLDVLMNTTHLAASLDYDLEPEVSRSILNFGLPDFVRVSFDENRVDDISRAIAETIATFETRLIKDSISVKREAQIEEGSLAVRFNVTADIRCDPVALPIEFIADLEIASGRLALRKR
jgi:type VI secretion system protein ImpF